MAVAALSRYVEAMEEWADEAPRHLLALLYVVKWAKYRRSPHVWRHRDPKAELKRLMEIKGDLTPRGYCTCPNCGKLHDEPTKCKCGAAVNWPHHAADPEDTHLQAGDFAAMIERLTLSVELLHPTNQEAWLTVELLGALVGFKHHKYLAGKSHCPWSFWSADMPGRLAEGHQTSRKFVLALGKILARVPVSEAIYALQVQNRTEGPKK